MAEFNVKNISLLLLLSQLITKVRWNEICSNFNSRSIYVTLILCLPENSAKNANNSNYDSIAKYNTNMERRYRINSAELPHSRRAAQFFPLHSRNKNLQPVLVPWCASGGIKNGAAASAIWQMAALLGPFYNESLVVSRKKIETNHSRLFSK